MEELNLDNKRLALIVNNDVLYSEDKIGTNLLIDLYETYVSVDELELVLKNFLNINIKVNVKNREFEYLRDGTIPIYNNALNSLIKTIIILISAENGYTDTVTLNYPESTLSPKVQSLLGFFIMMQLEVYNINIIIRTNSEHLINRVQYEIFKKFFKKVSYRDVIIYVLNNDRNNYKEIGFDNNGDFTEDFPEGFFDVSVDYLMEMI